MHLAAKPDPPASAGVRDWHRYFVQLRVLHWQLLSQAVPFPSALQRVSALVTRALVFPVLEEPYPRRSLVDVG
jgi:hypothetical protein